MKYAFTCTCGHKVAVDADGREAAVEQIKGMMTQDFVTQHFSEKHAGQPTPTLEQALAGVDQAVHEVV